VLPVSFRECELWLNFLECTFTSARRVTRVSHSSILNETIIRFVSEPRFRTPSDSKLSPGH